MIGAGKAKMVRSTARITVLRSTRQKKWSLNIHSNHLKSFQVLPRMPLTML